MAGAIINLYRKLRSMHKEEVEQNKAMRDAMLAILRDRIFQSCNFHIQNKYITTSDLDVLNGLFTSYEKLGGNGVVAKLRVRIDKLEIRVEDIH